jgi:hypothetical protein
LRFDGTLQTLTAAERSPLVDLSIVHELDLCEQASDVATRHGDCFRTFRSWADLDSPQVTADARTVLNLTDDCPSPAPSVAGTGRLQVRWTTDLTSTSGPVPGLSGWVHRQPDHRGRALDRLLT